MKKSDAVKTARGATATATATSGTPPQTAPLTPPVIASTLQAWEQRINPFASAVSKDPGIIASALEPLVGTPSNDAAEALADVTVLTEDELANALVRGGPKIPLAIFRKHLPKLRGSRPAAQLAEDRAPTQSYEGVLPTVPEDESFLQMLQVGGVLKPGKTEVISAIKAAIADSLGIYDLPRALVKKMETFAEQSEEPVGENFFRLRKLMIQKNYAEVLSVLNVEGSFVSASRMEAFIERLNQILWPALRSFHNQLMEWQTTWTAGATNPGMILAALAMGQSGQRGIMPPGMLQPPDTATIRDEATAVIDKVNKIFAGVGIPIARALAYDATRIKTVLEDPTLPAAIGTTTKDMMLKMLGMGIGADYVRLERNVTRYALSIIELPNVSSGNEEYSYLGALLQLGASIPWDKLPGGPAAPVQRNGSRGSNGRMEREREENDSEADVPYEAARRR